MKHLRYLTLAIVTIIIALQACEVQTPPESNPAPTPELRIESSETYHYHDGINNMAREVVLDRYADGSVTVTRRDIPRQQATHLVDFVTLDSDPIPANSEAKAIYGPGSDTWFIPFGNGPTQQLGGIGVGLSIDIRCGCLRPSVPGPDGECYLFTERCGGCDWQCKSDGSCLDGCTAQIIFSGKVHHEPGIVLKSNQITIL